MRIRVTMDIEIIDDVEVVVKEEVKEEKVYTEEILKAISEKPMTLDEIVLCTGLKDKDVRATLKLLESKGLVRHFGGARGTRLTYMITGTEEIKDIDL